MECLVQTPFSSWAERMIDEAGGDDSFVFDNSASRGSGRN
jgi:hypothetical protein